MVRCDISVLAAHKGFGELYQDQLAIVGYLAGPGGLRPLPFLQGLLTADLVVRLPLWKTLRTERDNTGQHADG